MHPHHEDDPIKAEGLRLLEEDPELAADLANFNRRLDAGEVDPSELHTTEEVRKRLGLSPPDLEPAPTD